MKLSISPEIVQRYPGIRISFVMARGIHNGPVNAALQAELRSAEERVRARFATTAELEDDSRIVAWHEIYRSFKANPKKYRPSAEALLRRVVKGGALPALNLATNAYLLPQLDHLLPVGGYDLSRVCGDICLRFSPGGEAFLPIGSTEPENTDTGEIVYADDEKILTRRWNYKDCDQAKITDESTDVALFIEGVLPQLTTDAIVVLAEAVAAQIQQHCGGQVSTHLLDSDQGLSADLGG